MSPSSSVADMSLKQMAMAVALQGKGGARLGNHLKPLSVSLSPLSPLSPESSILDGSLSPGSSSSTDGSLSPGSSSTDGSTSWLPPIRGAVSSLPTMESSDDPRFCAAGANSANKKVARVREPLCDIIGGMKVCARIADGTHPLSNDAVIRAQKNGLPVMWVR